MARYTILALNPGSTSTKLAIYDDDRERFSLAVQHSAAELSAFATIQDQYSMRRRAVLAALEERNFSLTTLSAVVGRGGLLPPVRSGAYIVNETMRERLQKRPVANHAANLGAVIAYDIARELGIEAYIYDAVAVDELEPIARITGLPEAPRRSLVHTLNMRANAIKVAQELQRPYDQCTFIVAHLGGGISISLHRNGKMIDTVADDEGPFSPQRAGRISGTQAAELCFSGKYSELEFLTLLRGKGGLLAHLGTMDTREVEKLVEAGDERARLIYEAMAYQVAKGIGELATVVGGSIDRIILTGGVAFSERFCGWIRERVGFIAPVLVRAGENELEALALGTLRVLRGEERPSVYSE